MDYSKSPPSFEHHGLTANLKPVRRRLQKLTPKTKIFGVKRSSHDSGISIGDSPSAPREMTTIGGGAIATSFGHNPFADEPVLPLPPDLSDSKWLDYIERSGLMFHEPTVTESVPKPMRRKPPPPIIPELSHLARARSSLDSTSSDSVPNSASTTSTMRRHAKTPVFRIGQLEGKTRLPAETDGGGVSFGRDPWIAEKTSSVELIAEQYCALLEHRDAMEQERERRLEREREERENDAASSIYTSSSSIYTAYQSEPALARPYSPVEVPRESLARHSSEDSPVNIILEPVRSSTLIAQYSPISVDGTYVGGDESAIYFKPVSFSHEPPSQSVRHTDDSVPSPSALNHTRPDETSDSLSLHICLDLLTKELSSAFADRSSRTGDSSALQVWVMIEAYERLQNRVACMEELPEIHRHNMQMVFQSWLGTLYAVHDMMSGKSFVDEREVEGLAEAVD